MLSIILYGRNDSHGYNYHKRLAISLNSLAEVLSGETDEIVFVDYQTPEDFPTAPEAIADTLTTKTKKHLKIFRVRGEKSSSRTVLFQESLCRNIGIRQTLETNRWILSTNIDMLFVPTEQSKTLTTLITSLFEGFYLLPRFELPENLWEREFDRQKPNEILNFLRTHAEKLHLNTVIKRPGFLGYDNPGDFQLMTREAIFTLHGFDEEMQQGWHVDANLCKRMMLYYGSPGKSLEDEIWGYHCNHTRQATLAHKQFAPENDWSRFVEKVTSPVLKHQADTWGLSYDQIEEIRLVQKPLTAMKPCLPLQKTALTIKQETFNALTYASGRIFPHLSDHFYHLPPHSTVAYVGKNQVLLKALQTNLQDEAQLMHSDSFQKMHQEADLIIFDFGFDQEKYGDQAVVPGHSEYKTMRDQLRSVMNTFLDVVKEEKKNPKKIKIIGINTLFTDFRALFEYHLSMQKTTFLTGISFGYVKQKQAKQKKKKKNLKKQIKFIGMYFLVRYFYSFSDDVRVFAYKNRLLKKIVSHK